MVARLLPYLARVGVDPRELTLVLYGGAGAVQGPFLASEVGIGRILAPRTPSVFCAFGGLVCGLVHDTVKTVHGEAMTLDLLKRTFAELEGEGEAWLARQDCDGHLTGHEIERSAEMRYRGQSFQTTVSLSRQAIAGKDLAAVEAVFHVEHEPGIRQPLLVAVQSRLSAIGETVDQATLLSTLAEEFERLTGESAPPA